METLHPRSIELGLPRVCEVQQAMGLQEPPFTIISISGTNGKGSTVAILQALLLAAGYRVGAYTSPHLVHYNERVSIDGQAVSDQQLCDAFARVEMARNATPLTFFEFGTLAAVDLFREAGVDIALLEVGMGGRLDAVNAWSADVAVLTSIGIDHVDWLGPDREHIGREKAGIFRSGRPAVCADPDPPASVLTVAKQIGAPLYCLGREFVAEPHAGGWTWRGPESVYRGLPIPQLRGRHQLNNAAAAIMTTELNQREYPLGPDQMRDGLQRVMLSGRFEVWPGPPPTILDVAHNPQATATLAQLLAAHPCQGRTRAVVGMLANKAHAETLAPLLPQVSAWYLTTITAGHLPAISAEGLQQCLGKIANTAPVRCFGQIAQAYQQAREDAGDDDRILVFGSFYTVGAIMSGSH